MLASAALYALVALSFVAPQTAVAQPEAERRIVFMVDQSGSMVWDVNDDGTPRQWTFSEEIQNSRNRAEAILTELQGYNDTAVSFWIFGRQDGLAPFDVQAVDLSPTEALERLDEFFAPDPGRYRQDRTYIAYSIFELVRQLLDLGEDFGPEDDIPADASLFYLFVFTDGGENHEPGWNNQPYVDWLLRQQRRLQLQYDTWTLYATGEDRDAQIERFTPEPADHITYTLNFGVPTAAYSLNPNDPPSDRTVSLEVPRVIRAIPSVGGGGPTLEQIQLLGLYVCETEEQDPPAPTDRTELLVQAAVDWGTFASGATSEWQINAPERLVDEIPVQGSAVPRRELQRDILRLRVEGAARAVIPTFQLPDGEYPIRYIADSLCQELRRTYPNSTFVFPAEPSGSLSRTGNFVVSQRPNYELTLTTPDSTTPEASLNPLVADRWHQYSSSERTLRLITPEGVEATVDFSVRAYDGDRPLDDASDLVTLRADGESAGLVTVASGEDIVVRTPADEQTWFRSAFGNGFGRDPGEYTISVCARARIVSAPDPSYTVTYACPDCDGGQGEVELGEDGPVGICATMNVDVERKPLSWWWIAFLSILTLIILWIAYRLGDAAAVPRAADDRQPRR